MRRFNPFEENTKILRRKKIEDLYTPAPPKAGFVVNPAVEELLKQKQDLFAKHVGVPELDRSRLSQSGLQGQA